MLSVRIQEALNQQISMEAYASFLYLSISGWCEIEGMSGCAEFFKLQSDEERMHMLKIFDYMTELEARAITPAVAQPPIDFDSIQDVFKLVYEQEKKVTTSINKIVDLAGEEKDHATWNFLQWYVNEQREEEATIRKIIDKIKLIGKGGQSLYYIDKEVQKISMLKAAADANEGADTGGGA